MKISLLVAISSNNVIGVDNDLPWHLNGDLQYFKKLTSGHAIIMGRKTYDSIGRPLPKRENIVITRNPSFQHEGLIIKNSIEEAINHCRLNNPEELFIIGGEMIYRQTILFATNLYITRVKTIIENATAFFPEIDLSKWTLISSEDHLKDEKNDYDYTFEVYEKRKNA